eukprot:13591538-Ditylum_brightwellii.AAC.1
MAWEHVQVRWKARNSFKHNNKHLGYNATKSALIDHIITVYTHQQELLEQDRFPFTTLLEKWQHKSVSEMKIWLKKNIPLTNYCQKVSTTQQDANIKGIQTFLIG